MTTRAIRHKIKTCPVCLAKPGEMHHPACPNKEGAK